MIVETIVHGVLRFLEAVNVCQTLLTAFPIAFRKVRFIDLHRHAVRRFKADR